MRQVILIQEEDGSWSAQVPSLPGCNSQGETRDEAIANIREAMELWIETVREAGRDVPASDGAVEVVELPESAA